MNFLSLQYIIKLQRRKEEVLAAKNLVAGHLQAKKGYWYCVITYKDFNGKPAAKWYSTGLKVTGNKRKAEAILLEKRIEWTERREREFKVKEDELMFDELILEWLNHKKNQVEETTYAGYYTVVHKRLLPYVRKHRVKMNDVDSHYVQKYIDYIYKEGLSHKTIKNHRGVLSGIFRYGIIMNQINNNPMEKLEPAVKPPPVENYYSAEMLRQLLEDVKDENIYLSIPVPLTIIYGLRRSEICGLRWKSFDFLGGKFIIDQIITEAYKAYSTEKKFDIIVKNYPKSKQLKTYPIIEYVQDLLLDLKEKQIKSGLYSSEGYLLLKDNGKLIRPNHISEKFSKFLKSKGYPHIRFHDLRHSCASALISDNNRDVSLKDVQLWLGHSNIQSTMRYAHISDLMSKTHTAEIMKDILKIENNDI